jgi:hypothetical protein
VGVERPFLAEIGIQLSIGPWGLRGSRNRFEPRGHRAWAHRTDPPVRSDELLQDDVRATYRGLAEGAFGGVS